MDEVHRELEEAKIALEKLTVDFRAKSELSENLRRAYEEQSAKLHEAKIKIDKQAQELCEKSEEIASVGRKYEDLKLSFQEKDATLKRLSSAHDQLRISLQGKLTSLERENGELLISLNDANARIAIQTQKLSAREGDIKKLKHLLLESQMRCVDAERNAEVAKDLKRRDDVMIELEREIAMLQDKLKWRVERFMHLEEAKEKIQEKFNEARKEWELEKCSLIDEICSLQKNLESKSRLADDLQSRLQISNQALAHEESRRKLMEIQMQESRLACQNVLTEYEEAALKINQVSTRGDEEIASLRSSLTSKDALLRESEHEKVILEQENMELLASLREIREAQISQAGAASSLKSTRQKLKSLELEHRECRKIMENKEAGWLSRTEKLTNELNECISRSSRKDRQLRAVKEELEAAYSSVSLLKLAAEESNVMSVVLLSKYREVQSDIGRMRDEKDGEMADKEAHRKEKERFCRIIEEKENELDKLVHELSRTETVALVTLEQTRIGFVKLTEDKEKEIAELRRQIEEGNESRRASLERLEYLETFEGKYLLMDKELRACREMLEESSAQLFRKDRQLRAVEEELEAAYSCVLPLKLAAEESNVMSVVLLSKYHEFQSDVGRMKDERDGEMACKEALEKEKERFCRIIEEKENEQGELVRELSRTETEALVTLEQTRIGFVKLTEDKEKEMAELRRQIEEGNESRRAFEDKHLLMEKELRACREMLEESSLQLLRKESSFKEQLGEAKSACSEKEEELRLANSELQRSKIDFESQRKSLREESQRLERELETSLLARLAAEKGIESMRREMDRLLQLRSEKDEEIVDLRRELTSLEANALERNRLMEAETLERERERIKAADEMSLLNESLVQLQSEKDRERKRAEEELQSIRAAYGKLSEDAGESKRKIRELNEAAGRMSSDWEKAATEAEDFSRLFSELVSGGEELKVKWERIVRRVDSPRTFEGEEREEKSC